MEPGRFIVGNAGVLLGTVLYRKHSGGKDYVIADAGMTELLRPSHYDAFHRIEAVQQHGEPRHGRRRRPGVRERRLPRARPRDGRRAARRVLRGVRRRRLRLRDGVELQQPPSRRRGAGGRRPVRGRSPHASVTRICVRLEIAEPDWKESCLMRVGLIADTHDRLPAIAELVRAMQGAGVDMVLHAGDYCSPFSLKPFEDAHISLAGVFGGTTATRRDCVVAGAVGVRHRAVRVAAQLRDRRPAHPARARHRRRAAAIGRPGTSIVIHGHTHQQEMKTRGDTLIVNPGEACGWLYGTPTARDSRSRQPRRGVHHAAADRVEVLNRSQETRSERSESHRVRT